MLGLVLKFQSLTRHFQRALFCVQDVRPWLPAPEVKSPPSRTLTPRNHRPRQTLPSVGHLVVSYRSNREVTHTTGLQRPAPSCVLLKFHVLRQEPPGGLKVPTCDMRGVWG